MYRRGGGLWLVAAVAIALAGARLAVAVEPAYAQTPVSASVSGNTTGQAMPPGFLGLSLEFQALHMYTGRNPGRVDPVFEQLIRNLNPGQAPVLRIGGDSSDDTWWPIRRTVAPGGVSYSLTEGWLRTTRALASDLGAQLILGVNLAAGRPALAAAEARAFLKGIGRSHISAIEIGNEPDLYSGFVYYRDRHHHNHFARRSSYGFSGFLRDFSRWRAAMPTVPLAGPAVAGPGWLASLGQFISSEPGLNVVTAHRYALHGCSSASQPGGPSVQNLLADSSSVGLAQSLAPFVPVAHQAGLQFRVGELNSASTAGCIGKQDVSDQFASALWMIDTLFNLAGVGVDGVNVHSLPHAAYELFSFSQQRGTWYAFVHPDYYGMLMFAQAFPAGAKLLQVSAPSSLPLKIWATRGTDGKTRVELINKDVSNTYDATVQLPIGSATGPATVSRLGAVGGATATGDITLGGQSFGVDTTTGRLFGAPQIETVEPNLVGSSYTVVVPPATAALLTR